MNITINKNIGVAVGLKAETSKTGQIYPVVSNSARIGDTKDISDMKWLALNEIPERDRCYLWASGLLGVKNIEDEISKWGNEISYPGQ